MLDYKGWNQGFLGYNYIPNAQVNACFTMINDEDNEDDDDNEITAMLTILHLMIIIILLCNYHLPDSGLNDLHLFLRLILTTIL